MTLVQLKHFVAIAELGSFIRASEKVHLTQPALSRSIHSLEDELGGSLFDRVGRSNDLTPLGNELLVRARRVLHEVDDLIDYCKSIDSGTFGPVRVGLGSTPGAMLTELLLKHFSQNQRGTRLRLARGASPLLLQQLQERLLDFLVVEVVALPPSVDIELEYLQPMQPGFMCRPGHPLLKRRGKVSLAQLAQYPVASTPLYGHVALELVQTYGAGAHPDALINVQSEEIAPLINLACHTDTVVLTMRSAAPNLSKIDVAPHLLNVAQFVIVSMRGRSESGAVREAKQLVRDTMHD